MAYQAQPNCGTGVDVSHILFKLDKNLLQFNIVKKESHDDSSTDSDYLGSQSDDEESSVTSFTSTMDTTVTTATSIETTFTMHTLQH